MKGKHLSQILLFSITIVGMVSIFTGHAVAFKDVVLGLSPLYGSATLATAYGSTQKRKMEMQNGHTDAT